MPKSVKCLYFPQQASGQAAEADDRQREVKDKAIQRQIELMKKKMKQKSEL